MIKVTYEEFLEMLQRMNVGETFNFYEEYDEESGDANQVYGVAKISLFDAEMIVINYYGGSCPYIIDVTYLDYEVDSEGFRNYFNDCKLPNENVDYVFIKDKNVEEN